MEVQKAEICDLEGSVKWKKNSLKKHSLYNQNHSTNERKKTSNWKKCWQVKIAEDIIDKKIGTIRYLLKRYEKEEKW